MTEAAIESVVASLSSPCRLIFADVQAPEWLRERLSARAEAWGLEIIRFDEPLWPQEVRRRLGPGLDTDYVVFIDNDVRVEPGCFEKLVACADETKAGIVGPLYLWGDGVQAPTIHMAGGTLSETQVEDGRILHDHSMLVGCCPADVASQLFRRPCDFVEFHCMLIRTELMRDPSLMDPDVNSVHEHIDVALAVRALGYPVMLEPAAVITYLVAADYRLEDLALFRRRWDYSAGQASLAAFSRRWKVIDDERAYKGVRGYLYNHRVQSDLLRPDAPLMADQAIPMTRGELAETRSGLLDLAISRGYNPTELAQISHAHWVATALMDGGYRPCSRPFINHLVGVASILVRYGFRASTVGAALLHSAYTHCPQHPGGVVGSLNEASTALGGVGSVLERPVRAFSLWDRAHVPSNLPNLSIPEAEVLMLVAANEIEMHLSGEFRYTGRKDSIHPVLLDPIREICQLLGAEGLATTLEIAMAESPTMATELVIGPKESFRFTSGKNQIVAMSQDVKGMLRSGLK